MLSRVLHWGPLLALSIIKCISFTSIHVMLMWWPPLRSIGGFIHFLVYMFWNCSILYHFLCTIFIGPGYLPLEWKPAIENDVEFLQYCQFCKGYKAPRAHHCRKCDRCVLKMDHHCPWINNCCGHKNHGHFIMFLLIAVIGCIHSSIILCCSLYRALNVTWYYYYGRGREPLVMFGLIDLLFVMFSIGLALGVIAAVGALLYFQVKSAVKNETSVESWIITKAIARNHPEEENFIYPYDLGSWRKNFSQVLSLSHGCRPPIDGINWPIVDGCNQYTLTIEQKLQKSMKRVRTRQYDIIESYSGRWFPCSKGFKICCHPPCTDEPRISLDVGDKILVTRWKRYWLYGERIYNAKDRSYENNGSDNRHRGWFPRRCAVSFVDCSSSDSDLKKND